LTLAGWSRPSFKAAFDSKAVLLEATARKWERVATEQICAPCAHLSRKKAQHVRFSWKKICDELESQGLNAFLFPLIKRKMAFWMGLNREKKLQISW